MPGLNGFQLVAGVVENCPQCRALLFSGNPSARENYASSAAEKTLEMLLKPVPPLDLLHAVRRTLDA
jgi:DNA-binding NtrC family response regulator